MEVRVDRVCVGKMVTVVKPSSLCTDLERCVRLLLLRAISPSELSFYQDELNCADRSGRSSLTTVRARRLRLARCYNRLSREKRL
jgi:hypothetical protein